MANKKSGTKKALAVGAGVAAAGALAYGAYKLYGKDGEKNRKKMKKWMDDAQKEMMQKMKGAQEMTASMYDGLTATVAEKYADKIGLSKEDAITFMKDLKKQGAMMMKAVKAKAKSAPKKMKPMAKKMAKKMVKKVAKKAVKKSGKK